MLRFFSLTPAWIALIAFFAPAVASAQGIPVGFSWRLDPDAMVMVIEADDQLDDLSVELRADGRSADSWTRGSLGTGGVWELSTDRPTRTTDYEITIEATYADEPGALVYEFTAEIYPPLEFEVVDGSFDPDARRFTMTMNQPADHVQVNVRGDDGSMLAERIVSFDGEAPGTPLEISWTSGPGNILTIDVRAESTTGAWSSTQFIPWQVEFEAVHVNFASGSAEIPAEDAPVLEARLREIQQTVDRVREWVDCKLYIAGYTDTVGGSADNQRLSEARARSLGAFLIEQGLDLPVYYQGFGESGLAVQTDDNVDEPENRRALFILSTRSPPTSSQVPRSNWSSLR